MEAYPDKWKWTNGIQQERARFLLPLAWLVRLDDTAEHRGWLSRIAGDLHCLPGRVRRDQGGTGQSGHGVCTGRRSQMKNTASTKRRSSTKTVTGCAIFSTR